MSLFRSSSVLALLCVAFAASAQNLVANPGFETGDFSGWSLTRAAVGSWVGVSSNGYYPHRGTCFAYFGADGPQSDSISQTIATIPGRSYTITYYLREQGEYDGKEAFKASFGSKSLSTGFTVIPYTAWAFVATATSQSTVLSFGGYSKTGHYGLDEISVEIVPLPTPEPASLAALGLGAVAMRRRRKRA